jgi:molecular chaperone DnaK
MTMPNQPRTSSGSEPTLLDALRESGIALEATAPPFDRRSAADDLRRSAEDRGLLLPDRTMGNLATSGRDFEDNPPDYDSEGEVSALRAAAQARGLLDPHVQPAGAGWNPPHAGERLTVFGIDLGTTASSIAFIDDNGQPAIINNVLGEPATPSAVYFESPRVAVVGRAAKDMALVAPGQVAKGVKRDLGTGAEYQFHGERHSPETISALILRELARAAQESTGNVVNDVVIAVPAYFGIAEREATRVAGLLAGLNVLDVLDEPIAAVLHYQAVLPARPGTGHVLVCDLGGSTFDATVVRIGGDAVSVVCADGDHRIGGPDWDKAIVGYLLDRFVGEHPDLRPQEDARFMQDLFIAAERLKENLSTVVSQTYVMRFAGAVARVNLTREKLEELSAPLLDRTAMAVRRVIEAARARDITHFDNVLLVGGATRMPAFTRMLQDQFGLAASSHEPELTVAKGAAVFALLRTINPGTREIADQAEDAYPSGRGPAFAGADSSVPTLAELAAATGLDLSELEKMARKQVATVVPRSFGVLSVDGRDPRAVTDPVRARKMILHLLAANTQLPADTGPYTFHTAVENQRVLAVEVWEQVSSEESDELADNRKIGEGLLRNLPPHLPARTPIEVTFFMSETGRLTVQAVESRSGTRVQFDLQIGDFDVAGMRTARQAVDAYLVSGRIV